MGKQSAKWSETEGDAWHARNVAKVEASQPDRVIRTLNLNRLKPKTVFEVGCGSGARLKYMRDHMGCEVSGCDVSNEALSHGYQDGLDLFRAHAGNVQLWVMPRQQFDMVIYGFCLYQCDPEDLFKIVYEGDCLLKDGGHLVIYDFDPDYAHSKPYGHDESLKTYKMRYPELWMAHPAYTLIDHQIFPHEKGEIINHDTRIAVTILKKDMGAAFPLES